MAYESFLNWQKEKKTTSFSESTLLVYFTAGAASPGRQGRQCLTKYFTNQNLF
jgi:hypothetical protein